MSDRIPILFADEAIVVVDKPAGLPTVPAPDTGPDECVRARVERDLGTAVWVVHRLDRGTSGVLLLARTADAHRRLCLAFEQRGVRKTYLAFTRGAPRQREGRITAPLHAARKGRVRPALPGEAGAREAVTSYIVRKGWARGTETVAMVEAHPETGRHHQIRAHLRLIGTPVLGDPVYGRPPGGPAGAPLSRLALHASRLAVPAGSGKDGLLTFEAPLPGDLTPLLHWLDATWAVVADPTSWPG